MNESNSKTQNAIKTDLQLLLECLKYQMKCPDSQKQALLTIYSICQRNDECVELLRDMGGIVFVYNLSRSSPYTKVKETALFTLSAMAETRESCKQDLCRMEMFSDLAAYLKQEVPLTQKRVAVYMLSVLVANNRSGQILAHSSGCVQVLLDIFRCAFPGSSECEGSAVSPLWSSASSALCGCVNNPQNEVNQDVCVSVYPLVKLWLDQLVLPAIELAQPVCSFIAMTVANNSRAQEHFCSVGGVMSLTRALICVTSDTLSAASCKLAVLFTKTLCACITDSPAVAAGLSEMQLVPELLLLLSSPNLDPADRLCVVLTIAHCTDASEHHQTQLLLTGGLPLIISLLTDSADEELKNAAIFVLQTCKQIAESVSQPVEGGVCDMEEQRKSARQLLQRIQRLEKSQQQVTLPHFFPHPVTLKTAENRPLSQPDDEITLCSDLLSDEIDRILCTPLSTAHSHPRCAGCMCSAEEVDSRVFSAELRSCQYLCDFHLHLLQTENQLKTCLRQHRALRGHLVLQWTVTRLIEGLEWDRTGGLILGLGLVWDWEWSGQLMWEFLSSTVSEKQQEDGCVDEADKNPVRRKRRNFSDEELVFLQEGVRRFGHCWNSILWAYPFTQSRTSIDLAKKYQRLQKTRTQTEEQTE
ncbi:telomere repeats-binding bouquet formation protein 1 [Chanos chanos]|uniref:Telomere repeats-binding bouquet formation protein 1 n=1 Tax=Chanos chanos TaxID=29144 RepID=A0A6J2WRE2_CHACN|nr:telomere repeats-binding bouquet formation protein 1 [Chanos chanos]